MLSNAQQPRLLTEPFRTNNPLLVEGHTQEEDNAYYI
jgi:hypothetical protein